MLALAGCAAPPPRVENHPWKPMAYVGFAESIDRLAGPGAVDCGMYNLLGHEVTRKAKRIAFDCVQAALGSRTPFKYGTLRIPIDSFATEVLVRSAEGTLWLIGHDQMIDDDTGETQQQWNQECHSTYVDRHTLIISREDCRLRSEGQLTFQ
jgi:hypothetical protein